MTELCNLDAVFYFHNVGQGGFYSGFIKNDEHDFNFVYDCGTLSGHNFLTDAISEIDGSRYSEQKLDLLVLSHLDADHVNGVSDLLTMRGIRQISILVMPYMTLLDRTILLSFYAKRKYDDSARYYEFLIDPVGFFIDNDIHVEHIVFLSDESDDSEVHEDNILPFDHPECKIFGRDNKEKEKIIREEYHLHDKWIKNLYCVRDFEINFRGIWKFEFWCDCRNINKDIYEKVTEKISALDLDVNDVKSVKILFKNNRKALVECYKDIKKEPNDMSVVLLHYPLVKYVRLAIREKLIGPFINWSPFSCICYPLFDAQTNVNATLLLGDINLKATLNLMWKYFNLRDRGRKIIICTVPHHGSRYNWKKDIMNRCKNGIFVISSGIYGRFKHPHKNVVEGFGKCFNPMLIWNNEYTEICMKIVK